MTEKRFDVVINEFDEVEYITDIIDCEDRDFADFIEFANEMAEENDQLKQKVDFYKYFQQDARELEKENEQLREEIKGLNDILARYEEKELESVTKKDKSCGHCKHLQIDGMFGMWCEKKHNWKEVKYCADFER